MPSLRSTGLVDVDQVDIVQLPFFRHHFGSDAVEAEHQLERDRGSGCDEVRLQSGNFLRSEVHVEGSVVVAVIHCHRTVLGDRYAHPVRAIGEEQIACAIANVHKVELPDAQPFETDEGHVIDDGAVGVRVDLAVREVAILSFDEIAPGRAGLSSSSTADCPPRRADRCQSCCSTPILSRGRLPGCSRRIATHSKRVMCRSGQFGSNYRPRPDR